MLYPLYVGTYRISSPFGPRGGVLHRGADFAAPEGTSIFAVEDGVVVEARGADAPDQHGWVNGFGGWIVIDHIFKGKKVSTVYGHLYPKDILVRVGQKVSRGQLIGFVGNNGQSTGAHLHFEIWPDGRLTGGTAVDPMPWLGVENVPTVPVDPAYPEAGFCCRLG